MIERQTSFPQVIENIPFKDYSKKLKKRAISFSPKNIAKKVPVAKNGPKGISDFKVFLANIINPIPIIAPMKKAKKREIKIFGQPKINPIKKANLISPSPIHLPREIKTNVRKKIPAPTAEPRDSRKGLKLRTMKIE